MRLNLGCGTDIRQGYINIDLLPTAANLPPELFRVGNFSELSWIARDNVVEEILAVDCIQHIPWPVFGQVIQHWCSKLQSNGLLHIRSIDMKQICRAYVDGNITLPELVANLYPPINPQIPAPAVMQVDLRSVSDLLRANGMTITVAAYQAPFRFVVEASKP